MFSVYLLDRVSTERFFTTAGEGKTYLKIAPGESYETPVFTLKYLSCTPYSQVQVAAFKFFKNAYLVGMLDVHTEGVQILKPQHIHMLQKSLILSVLLQKALF